MLLSNTCRSKTCAPPVHWESARRPFGLQTSSCIPDKLWYRSLRNSSASPFRWRRQAVQTPLREIPSLFAADAPRPFECVAPSRNSSSAPPLAHCQVGTARNEKINNKVKGIPILISKVSLTSNAQFGSIFTVYLFSNFSPTAVLGLRKSGCKETPS